MNVDRRDSINDALAMMRWKGLFAVGAMLCAGCTTGVAQTPCLHLREYTATEQGAVADELGRLGPASMTGRFMTDYGALRDEVRAACR